MAVAEKAISETSKSTSKKSSSLVVPSVVGAVFLLVAAGLLFDGLPLLWISEFGPDQFFNPYLSTSLLMMASVVLFGGLVYAGTILEGMTRQEGQRAGSVILAVTIFLAGLLGLYTATWLASADYSAAIVYSVGGVVAVVIIALVGFQYTSDSFNKWLVNFEGQGWFHSFAYKFNQGLKVRRGTLIALLVVIGTGVYSAVRARLFGSGNWEIPLPASDYVLYLLFRVEYLGPLLTFAILGWFSWRVVNYPKFADFLIATEAELNKVSWTTRKRLFQDTIVVLVTVFLLTVFLFVVDMLWVSGLSFPFPGVLRQELTQQQANKNAPAEW